MADSYLITPSDIQSGRRLITNVNGFNPQNLLFSKAATATNTENLILDDGNTSIDLGVRVLASNFRINQEISINGNQVIWDSYESAGEARVKYYNGTSTIDLGTGYTPHFYQQGVVWGNEAGVQYFNGQTTIQLSNVPLVGSQGVKTSGNNLVWSGSDGAQEQLYFYNGSTTQQITTDGYNSFTNRSSPPNYKISGNQVIWNSYVTPPEGSFDPPTLEIYYFDGNQTQKLTSNSLSDYQPDFYQGKPIWTGPDNADGSQLFTYENGQVRAITTAENTPNSPYTIIDGLVTWMNYDQVSGQSDIYAYNGQQVINLSNTPDSSEILIESNTDRIYWQVDNNKFGYINGQVRQLDFGEGNYNILVANNNNFILEGDATYRATAFDSNQVKRGTATDDRLVGNLNSSNIIYGLDGSDQIIGGNNTDNLYGGNGNDQIEAKGGDDLVYGGNGNNQINGGEGNDVIFSGEGNDSIRGGAGNDRIDGGNGNNNLEGGDGNDSITAGDGDSRIQGGSGNDNIYGGSGRSTIEGGSGNDYISANYGEIYGGVGNDNLNGGEGDILIKGGAGNDIIFGGYSLGKGELYGDAGDDQITGKNGDDKILGGDGNDTIFGEDGNDVILGGSGNDIITGYVGNDQLTGGGGNDTFVFGGFLLFADYGVDRIMDFNVGQDKIELNRAPSPTPYPATINFAIVAQDIQAESSIALIVYSKASGNLFYNDNGIDVGFGSGGEFATLVNKPQNLTTSNFAVV